MGMPRRVLVVAAADPAEKPLLKVEVLTADMPHPGWMRFELEASAPEFEEPTVCWYRVPAEAASIELQSEVTEADIQRRADGEDVIDAVGRDLVDAIRGVLGSAGLYRGRRGLPYGELWKRLQRDHAKLMSHESRDLDEEVFNPLLKAGVIVHDPDVRSSAVPRFLLPE
jgi:hypothetical protein